jgi:hypothetical protein
VVEDVIFSKQYNTARYPVKTGYTKNEDRILSLVGTAVADSSMDMFQLYYDGLEHFRRSSTVVTP